MKLKLPTYFSQKDSRWGSKKLGTSTIATISSDGCLLCCATAVLNYHGEDTTPDRLNDDLTRVKGWYKACRLIYGAVTDIYSDVTVDWKNYIECADVGAPLEKIDAILESKRIPIVRVDYKPETAKLDEHWVCIIGKNEANDYLIYDPIDGSEQWFQNRYKEPSRYIFKIVVYNGEIKEEENGEDKIQDLEDKIKARNEQILEQSVIIGQLEGELKTQEADNKSLTKQIITARQERDLAKWEKKDLEGVVKKQEKQLISLGESEEGLRERLKACKDKAVEGLGWRELIALGIIRLFKGGGKVNDG